MSSLVVSTDKQTVDEEVQGTITASLDDVEIGHLTFTDYADYQGGRRVQITEIVVSPEHRRQGIATQMVAELRQQVPTSRAGQFSLNPAGKALTAAIFDRFSQPIEQGP